MDELNNEYKCELPTNYTVEYILTKQNLLKLQKEVSKRNQIFENVCFRFIKPDGFVNDDYRPERQNFIFQYGVYVYDGNY